MIKGETRLELETLEQTMHIVQAWIDRVGVEAPNDKASLMMVKVRPGHSRPTLILAGGRGE